MAAALTLKDLHNGDIFCHAKSKAKKPPRFILYGNPAFNRGHGSATRMCKMMDGTLVSKSCRMEVVKLGESIHKEKIQALFDVKKIAKTN